MPKLALYLLGQFHATLDGETITAFKTDKVRGLLAYLAVEAGRAHRRNALGALLWPESAPEPVRANLRQSLCRLRDALDDHENPHPFVAATPDAIQFDPSGACWVDVLEFNRLVAACAQHRHRRLDTCQACAGRLAQAVALYRGEFLGGLCIKESAAYAEWSLAHQQTLHRKVMEALGQLAQFHLQRGEAAIAETYLQRQVTLEPWCEAAHRQLMHLYAAGGRRGEAIAQYLCCRRALLDQLGLPPEHATTSLYASICAGLPLTLPARRPANAPAQTTSFVGRAQELAQIGDLLQNPDVRLVTLVGLGGCGKTRLALEVAARAAGAFRDGAWFCPLGPIGATQPPWPALAQALGLPYAGDDDAQAHVLHSLRHKDLLLVLDNLEHLAATGWLAHLLHAAPGVVILATARHKLGLHAEWRFEVNGLAYPEPNPLAAWTDAQRYPAVQLFIQRGAQARADFALTDANTPEVVRICRQVEGLPLALELAASWVSILTCAQIADAIGEGLGEGLDFLASTWRDAPARQRSLRAAFDYSWNLLNGEEQEAFATLAVFRGEFSHVAARAVVGNPCSLRCRQAAADEHPDAHPGEQLMPSAGCLFRAFAEKALLQEVAPGRYRLHGLLRQYAEEKLRLSGAGQGAARERYLRYYAGLADRAAAACDGPHADVWVNRLRLEHDNLEAALIWALAEGETHPDVAPRLARALAMLAHG